MEDKLMKVINGIIEDYGIATEKVGGKIYVNEKEVVGAMLAMIEERFPDGDIQGTSVDLEALRRFNEANRLAKRFCVRMSSVEIECSLNWSSATTTITCRRFGFAQLNDGSDSKELFDEFLELIDFLTVDPNPIDANSVDVTFAVENVCME